MKDLEKLWRDCSNELLNGNTDYQYFSVSGGVPTFAVGNKSLTPHTQIIFWQKGTERITSGLYNQKPVVGTKEETEEMSPVKVIVNESKKDRVKLLIMNGEYSEKYPINDVDSDKHHRLLLLQENRFFISAVLYDSKLGNKITVLQVGDDSGREQLRHLVLSYLGELIIEDSCVFIQDHN